MKQKAWPFFIIGRLHDHLLKDPDFWIILHQNQDLVLILSIRTVGSAITQQTFRNAFSCQNIFLSYEQFLEILKFEDFKLTIINAISERFELFAEKIVLWSQSYKVKICLKKD